MPQQKPRSRHFNAAHNDIEEARLNGEKLGKEARKFIREEKTELN